MCRVLVSLLLFSLSACSLTMDRADELSDAQLEERYAQLDTNFRAMAGAPEGQLLSAMGRMPDTSFPAGNGEARVLQWWWDTPTCAPKRRVGGYSPSPAPVRESLCIVEWTVADGISQTLSACIMLKPNEGAALSGCGPPNGTFQ